MSEKTDLHDPFIKYLKREKLMFTRKNWNNHNRQVDDGFPDFSIPIDFGITLYIEFKTKEKFYSKNYGLSKKQIEWKHYLKSNGHEYLVTCDLDIAINFVEISTDHRAG